eukprot:TRINITY_DN4525_c0_g1_i6.p1 TRINITY_DN4525_c0_g1~~TRINITY_DN4525_c0_g1_i6.p1  ORF type:complete len:264 (+),score=13.98 TRINITY_DN4525_c0_g1_i6:57-848(+)
MGLIKVAMFSGVSILGIYSYRSVNRVNMVVQKIKVQNYTLLGKHKPQDGTKEYKDAYSIDLPRRFKLVQGTGSAQEISASDLARAFFTCKLFNRFEKPILTKLVGYKHSALQDVVLLNYKAFRFKEGDQILVWTVKENHLNEVLLYWEYGGLKGTTWFCVPLDNTIQFGSSFPRPSPDSETPSVQDFITSKPKQLFIDASSNLPDSNNIPLKSKIRNFALKVLYRLSVPVHEMYSKFLLESTLERLLEMKNQDAQDDRAYKNG